MTTLAELYPSRFLKAEADFDEGETKTLTISGFEIEELGKTKKETKPVLYFKELDKGLVLNKTNAAIIAENLGTETLEEWVGRQIILFTMEVQSFDDIVRAIRVKPKGKVKAAPKPTNGNSQPVTQKTDAEVIADEIRKAGERIPNASQPPDLKSLQRLAAVVNASFGNTPAETQDAMRHAVYSYVVGKEVQTGRDLTFGLVNAMLTRWESNEAYKPNDIASWETNAISFEYQTQHGQKVLAI